MQKKKKIIIFSLVAVLLVGGVVFAITRKSENAKTVITNVVATKGNISSSISSSGTVYPIEEYTIVTSVTGEILSDNVEIGQEYQKGDLLYTIDDTDAKNAILKAENSLEKQKMSYEQFKEDLDNLVITSPFSGRISKLYVSEGDKVNTGTKLLDLVDSTTLKVVLPFIESDARYINVGNKATVYIDSTGEEIIGTVEKVSTGTYANSYGALVSDVEITFTNPGNILSGEIVSAMVGTYACNYSSEVSYKNETTITAETSGTITSLNYSSGDIVDKYAVILELEDANTVLNSKSSSLSLKDAQIELEEAKEDLNDCTITSPITGVVTEKYYKKGNTITNSNSTTLAVIADMSKLTFSMNIDELDIKNIALGQKVLVTADAIENQTFNGVITNINIVGSPSNGVTTYPVTVEISEYEGLLPGMNVSAQIISKEVTDVVMVPTSAVSRGDVVLVTEEYAKSLEINKDYSKEDSESGNENEKGNKKSYEPGKIVDMPNTPSGYKYIKVTTGLSDENYIEIKEGITEGTQVYIISTIQENKSLANTSSNTAVGSMPIGGAAIGGGMPMSGGNMMSSGNRGNKEFGSR